MKQTRDHTPAERPVAALETAAAQLRERLAEPAARDPLPESYVLLGVARLLDELARSVQAGQPPHEHVMDAAAELSAHIARHSGR